MVILMLLILTLNNCSTGISCAGLISLAAVKLYNIHNTMPEA